MPATKPFGRFDLTIGRGNIARRRGAPSSLSFASAITDSANNSVDMRYTMSTTTRDSYGWMTTGGASDEQAIDTSFSASMDAGTKTALLASGSLVIVSDIYVQSGQTAQDFRLSARTTGGTTTYNINMTFDIDTDTWNLTPTGWDHYGFADVSGLYSLSAGSVYRLWGSVTNDGTNTRFFTTGNDSLDLVDFRRFCVFDRTEFNATDATMDTEIAALVP